MDNQTASKNINTASKNQFSYCLQRTNQEELQNTITLIDKGTNITLKKSIHQGVQKEDDLNITRESSATDDPKGEKLFGSDSSIKKDNIKSIEEFGVRVSPSIVRFNNTFENQTYTETVAVQNISDTCVTVRIHKARAWSFRLTPLERGYLLAPGLKISRHIHYTCSKNGVFHSTLPIYVNENVINLPLEANKSQVFVDISPTSLQFGRVDIGCKPVDRKIYIKNMSLCATKFLVDLGNNDLDLQVSPLKGWIRPNSNLTLTVRLLVLRVGVQTTEFWISTDLCQTRIFVEVEACRRNFLVRHPNTISEFTLVDFPATFYGCHRYQTVVVYNMAASTSSFVVLVVNGNRVEEPFEEAKTQKNVKMFHIEPTEGKIRPFEERIFTFWFCPILVKENESMKIKGDGQTRLKDFICSIKIKRIQVDDTNPNLIESKNNNISVIDNAVTFPENIQKNNSALEREVKEGKDLSSILLMNEISVLLYLYGEAEIPSLNVTPDALYFPNTLVGSTINKVVQLTNNTNQTLAYKYNKIPFFEVFPGFKKLVSKTSFDIQVQFNARNMGDCKTVLTFDVLAEANATDNENLHVVNHVTVKIFGNVKSTKVTIQPKFTPGITSLAASEVILTEEMTFGRKPQKLRGAMTFAANVGRLCHQMDATIPFPNNRPFTLHPQPTDPTAKTIYKDLSRYTTPIDKPETFTLEKTAPIKAYDDQFVKYFRGTAAISVSKKCCCKRDSNKVDSSPHNEVVQEKNQKLPREFFVPLTIVQLYRVKVHPSLISFGCVTISKTCYQPVSISNENDFKISAKLVPLTSGINIQMLEHFIISEKSETTVMLTFERARLGKYSGTITCIINGFHSFDIAVVAEVVHRSLTIKPNYVEIKIPDIPFADICFPVSINNPLNIPINFSWVIPVESPIKIEPTHGVAPKLGTIWCGVLFEPENPNYKLHPLRLMVEGTSSIKLSTGVFLPKTNVYFLESVLNIGYIPMNLTTVRRFMVFNPDFSDAMFIILNKEPVKGVNIIPSAGSIKAKCCQSFSLYINLSTEKALDFIVYMTLQNTSTIELKVTGSVVYPEVEVTPKYINLHRVPCNSIMRTTIIAENKSRAKAEVTFNMDEYPQFKISQSKRHHDPGLTSCGVTLEQGASLRLYLHFIPKDLASYEFYLPIIINGLQTLKNSNCKEIEAQGKMFKNMSKTYSSKQNKNVHMSHFVLVNVVVLKASLVFSDLNLSFSSTSETKNFSIKNASDQPVRILAHCEDFHDFLVFLEEEKHDKDRCSIQKVAILPGQSITYKVIFQATSPGLHVCDVTIYVSFDNHDNVYNAVRLTGHIPLPCIISSSMKEIYFEPVPLNTEISCIFNLEVSHNKKEKETIIRHGTTNALNNVFTIEYPKGSTVAGINNCTIPVKITFKSSYPTSLRKEIVFKGDEHNEESVLVIATANNCLLTTHAFLEAHSKHQTRLKTDEGAIQKLSEDEKEQKSISKHQIFKPPILLSNDSSSGESFDKSSVKTFIGLSGNKFKENKSMVRSSIMRKKANLISNSDMELSFQLNENEEIILSRKQSLSSTEIITVDNEKLGFPMFPLEPTNEKALYMLKTLKSVEQWVYEQVFCCSYNPKFGSYSFSSFLIANKKDYSSCSPAAFKNVFDVLERICGRRIRRYFTPVDKIPENATGKALFSYGLYRQLLDFMDVQGALMAHVEPKYLMVYEEYCIHHKLSHMTDRSNLISITGSNHFSDDAVDSEPMSSEKFQSISIQCWLDLFLQIFKIFVLGPAVGITCDVLNEDSKQVTVKLNDGGPKKVRFGAEDILLSWLTHQYNTYRTVVWPGKSPPPRTVTNFDSDLEDGLVLTVTTAAYCPYLSEIYFNDMCLHPTSISHAYHNSTCLCMAWGCIKLGFSITPRDFVHSNMIQMLLLVTHLYQVLPSYKPESTIVFKAILNDNESQIVTLKNNEELSVTYHVEILPSSSNFFLDNCPNTLVLKRKSTSQITVRYLARNTNKAEAILLVCGACMPPKFGRNYVFKLEGLPVKLPVSASYNIVSPQNIAIDTHITVESPHKLELKADESLSYSLWISYTEPQPENLNAVSFANIRKRKMPRRIFFKSNTLIVTAGKGKSNTGVLSFKVCCYSQIVRVFWLILRNQEVGDFIVKMQVTPQRPEPVICLQVMMNRSTTCACESEVRFGCSRSATVKVPCRNVEQWTAIRTMFELTLSREEKVFWAKYIESKIGFRLLQWMLEEKKDERRDIIADELEILFEKSKTYNITCASKYVRYASTLHIPDVRSQSFLPFQLHLDQNTPSHSTVLTMTSTDGFEIRCFNLKIVISDESY